MFEHGGTLRTVTLNVMRDLHALEALSLMKMSALTSFCVAKTNRTAKSFDMLTGV